MSAFVALLAAAPASAILTAYEEPAFTKPRGWGDLGLGASNTWWFRTDVGTGPAERYCLTLKEGATTITSLGCEENSYGARDFARTAFGLKHGHTYWIYIEKWVWGGFGHGWVFYPQSSYGSVTTTIDGSLPAIETRLNGGAEHASSPALQIHLDYADTTSPPWPASFVCASADSPCNPQPSPTSYSPACSTAIADNASRTRSHFDCQADVSTLPDGRVYVCAAGADSAPLDPWGTSKDQFAGGAYSANIGVGCDSATLDRAAPSVTPTANAATPTVGQLVMFRATASDATSGVDATTYSWNFGDNAPTATGESVSHTYTQAGTYQVRVSVKDKAGNTGTATMTMTVSVPQSPNPTPPNPTPPSPGPTPGGGPEPSSPSSDRTPPDTRITLAPARRTARRSATFSFRATEAGATFRCRIDARSWKTCGPPTRYRRLAPGLHTFRVAAADAAGNRDPRPAIWRWRITRR